MLLLFVLRSNVQGASSCTPCRRKCLTVKLLLAQIERSTLDSRNDCVNVSLQGYLAVSDLPLVSMDFKKSDVSTTIDSSLTMVMGDDMVKVCHNFLACAVVLPVLCDLCPCLGVPACYCIGLPSLAMLHVHCPMLDTVLVKVLTSC